jgi:hypothetical protein
VFWVLLLIGAVWLNEFLCRRAGLKTAPTLLIDAIIVVAIVIWVTRKFLREATRRRSETRSIFRGVLVRHKQPLSGRKLLGRSTSKVHGHFGRRCDLRGAHPFHLRLWFQFFGPCSNKTFSTWVLQAEKMESHFFARDSGFGNVGLRNPKAMAEKITVHTNAVTELLWSRLSETNRPVIANANRASPF